MNYRTWAMAAGTAVLLAGCSGGGGRIKTSLPPASAAPASETDTAFTQLMAGDPAGASKRLKAVLKRNPMDPTAKLLLDSIDRDPKELLGPENHAYTVVAGDTMVGLAERFLGNRLKAYQLLRYNGLTAPAALAPGQILRIPGEAPRAEPVRRTEPAPTRPSSQPAKPKTAAPKPTVSKPAAPAADPAAARQARAAGLAALNQGNVNRAVGLLRRAAALDPGNPLISRDLARAERIAATVRSHK